MATPGAITPDKYKEVYNGLYTQYLAGTLTKKELANLIKIGLEAYPIPTKSAEKVTNSPFWQPQIPTTTHKAESKQPAMPLEIKQINLQIS